MAEQGVPEVEITGVEEAHRRLESRLSGLDDAAARSPSLLPGWSVGHVLSHLARNADSVVRRLDGAAAGRVVDQYPGGAAGRVREIEEGAERSAPDLVADVVASNHAVEAALARHPVTAWDRLTRSVGGHEIRARAVVFSRWREVEVHHVDLGLGYTPVDWPEELVVLWLPQARQQFLDHADQREVLAWLVGRGPAPQLPAWE